METDPVAVARAVYAAFVRKDRAAMEALLAADYRFTSPFDNGLDRATYLTRCFPYSAQFASIDVIHATADGARVFVVYEARMTAGKRFRNCEMHTVRDGKLVATEVYFGWGLPHKAKPGGFIPVA